MEKIIQCKWKTKERVATLISDKLDCKPKSITRDKKGHCVMINGSIHQKDVTFVSIYVPNIGAPKYTANVNRSEGRKRQEYNNSRDINTSLSTTENTDRKSVWKHWT